MGMLEVICLTLVLFQLFLWDVIEAKFGCSLPHFGQWGSWNCRLLVDRFGGHGCSWSRGENWKKNQMCYMQIYSARDMSRIASINFSISLSINPTFSGNAICRHRIYLNFLFTRNCKFRRMDPVRARGVVTVDWVWLAWESIQANGWFFVFKPHHIGETRPTDNRSTWPLSVHFFEINGLGVNARSSVDA